MAYDVFLSYARVDTDRARQIKDLLEELGLSVFFDTEGLDGGDVFPDVLDEAVKTSGAVVGVWSAHALTRPWVKIECDIGKTRGVLVPLQIEQIPDLDRPAAFWNIQFADLSDFSGDPDHTGWLRFVRSLARTLDRPELLERESARQAATPVSDESDVRAELAALRAEMTDMRRSEPPAQPVKQVEITKTGPSQKRSKAPWIIIGLVAAIALASAGGWFYFNGLDTDPPPTRTATATPAATPTNDGVAYHIQSCENGIATGCMSAATAYAYGEGVEVDQSLSLDYYDRGCDLGDLEACWVGGIVYEQGGDLDTARARYDRACQGGAQDGCGLLEDLDKMTATDTQATQATQADDAFYAQLQSVATITIYRTYLRDDRYTRHEAAVRAAVDKHEKAVKHLQRALQDKAIYNGAIDGQITNRLLESIAAFNSRSNMVPPGDVFSINSTPVDSFAANVEAWSPPEPAPVPAPWDQISDQDWSTRHTLEMLNEILQQTSFSDLKRAADNGQANAAQLVAEAYDHGVGGANQDYAIAVRYYTTACNGGNMSGCASLGTIYQSGQGVTQDYGEARRLYTKACNGGNMGGCTGLGFMHLSAQGMTQDFGEARRLLTNACNGGEMTSCDYLGGLYLGAEGVTQDYGEARRFYAKSCNGGYKPGCGHLGEMTYQGAGIEQDQTEGLRLLNLACDSDHLWSCDRISTYTD